MFYWELGFNSFSFFQVSSGLFNGCLKVRSGLSKLDLVREAVVWVEGRTICSIHFHYSVRMYSINFSAAPRQRCTCVLTATQMILRLAGAINGCMIRLLRAGLVWKLR